MTKTIIVVAIFSAILGGCTANRTASGDTFTTAQTRQAHFVTYGTLVSVRSVTIQGGNEDNAVGAIGGAVVGGFLGNTIGGGSGRNLATAAGAVGGATVGAGVQSAMNRSPGVELEVRRDDGVNIVVVQAQGATQFHVGQRVALVTQGNTTTVSPR